MYAGADSPPPTTIVLPAVENDSQKWLSHELPHAPEGRRYVFAALILGRELTMN
jgi:hypothetical protein